MQGPPPGPLDVDAREPDAEEAGIGGGLGEDRHSWTTGHAPGSPEVEHDDVAARAGGAPMLAGQRDAGQVRNARALRGGDRNGTRKDTVIVLPGQQVASDFDAANPG
jgi:hypothetical protein